jgi:serine phosphatase RsbU (regulator of sigma subunit)
MLGLRNLFQMRLDDAKLQALIHAGPGVTIIAGPEGRLLTKVGTWKHAAGFLPSGRTMVLRTLVDEIIESGKDVFGILVTTAPGELHTGRGKWRHIHEAIVNPAHSYADRIMEAAQRNPAFILVDDLNEQNTVPVLEAARRGQRVIAQMNTPLRAKTIYCQLMAFGGTQDQLRALTWVLAVQRMPILCSHCRRAVLPNGADMKRLDRLLQTLAADGAPLDHPSEEALAYSDAPGCAQCQFSGRLGDVSVMDLWWFDSGRSEMVLPVEACLWHLVQRGMLPLQDLLEFDQEVQLSLYNLFQSSSNNLTEMHSTLERTRSELEAVNRVLEHRNQALFSFQDIGYALIRSDDLYDLARRVCRRASELCHADRAILYYLRQDDLVEVAAVTGWDDRYVHQRLNASSVFRPRRSDVLQPYKGIPPGILDEETAELQQKTNLRGLYVPLIAQEERVGALIIQTYGKAAFNPGDTAMVQAFANQAALALQRAGLVEDLRTKIAQLESAQVALAEKERMQREMELARQVQLSVLPQAFPHIPGYQFAARSEAARHVGGDFYDVIDLDEDHFGITIADVSDKGMPAALYMVLTRTLLVAQARRDDSPAQVLHEVNHLIQELSTARMFVTVFYGVVEKHSGRLRYARAGHDLPVLITPDGARELGGEGIALGVVETERFHVEEVEVELRQGDRLVLYTDGLTDVFSSQQEQFGRERLFELLKTCARQDSNQICQTVFRSVAAFQGPADQFDDQTMLVVEVVTK